MHCFQISNQLLLFLFLFYEKAADKPSAVGPYKHKYHIGLHIKNWHIGPVEHDLKLIATIRKQDTENFVAKLNVCVWFF